MSEQQVLQFNLAPRLKAALAQAGMTLAGLASAWGVTPDHLRLVAKGERPSQHLREKIYEFIAQHLPE